MHCVVNVAQHTCKEAAEASDAGSEEPNVEGTADVTVEVSTRQSG